MGKKKAPARRASDSSIARLPKMASCIAQENPELWQAFQRLGEQASRAGPIEARTRRLIHLALAIASGSEGATHSHTRRAIAEGIPPEELEHVAKLAITTIGWSHAVKGLTWVRDVTQKRPAGEEGDE